MIEHEPPLPVLDDPAELEDAAGPLDRPQLGGRLDGSGGFGSRELGHLSTNGRAAAFLAARSAEEDVGVARSKGMSIDTTPDAPTTPDARITIPQHVVFRSFVKETVVLNLDTGRYHGLNPVGGRMLEALKEVGVVRDAAARLAQTYGVPAHEIERDLLAFCDELAARGLIERAVAAS